MLKILVTGASGFIGKNLLKKLDKKNFEVLKFNRNHSLELLEEYIKKSDFIIHLAGEVRPNSTDDAFKSSNTLLTKKIIDLLKKNDKKIPIIVSSTIHAQQVKNEYGKTKRDAELLIENYANETNTDCYIYRLPHLFGEGCKPNYNSVISTWIYNSIHNLEINVFDREIIMHYVYVQDIIDEFISILEGRRFNNLYISPDNIYETTLGEVVDLIHEFKKLVTKSNIHEFNSEFKQKLINTYIDYYRNVNVE